MNKEFESKWCSHWVTRWKTWNRVWFRQKKEIHLLSKAPRSATEHSHTLIRGLCGKLFFWGKSGWGVYLTIHLHLTPRSRKIETKPSRWHIHLLLALGQLNVNFISKATFLFRNTLLLLFWISYFSLIFASTTIKSLKHCQCTKYKEIINAKKIYIYSYPFRVKFFCFSDVSLEVG